MNRMWSFCVPCMVRRVPSISGQQIPRNASRSHRAVAVRAPVMGHLVEGTTMPSFGHRAHRLADNLIPHSSWRSLRRSAGRGNSDTFRARAERGRTRRPTCVQVDHPHLSAGMPGISKSACRGPAENLDLGLPCRRARLRGASCEFLAGIGVRRIADQGVQHPLFGVHFGAWPAPACEPLPGLRDGTSPDRGRYSPHPAT